MRPGRCNPEGVPGCPGQGWDPGVFRDCFGVPPVSRAGVVGCPGIVLGCPGVSWGCFGVSQSLPSGRSSAPEHSAPVRLSGDAPARGLATPLGSWPRPQLETPPPRRVGRYAQGEVGRGGEGKGRRGRRERCVVALLFPVGGCGAA